jgi:hypothetical protein
LPAASAPSVRTTSTENVATPDFNTFMSGLLHGPKRAA